MTPDELLSLRLPDELNRVIAAIEDDLAAGRSPVPLLRGLSVLNSLALVDVVIGPKAPGGSEMILAALSVIAPLESMVPAGALYRRLVRQAGTARGDVLHAAVTRHPDADWLIALSRLAEGELAGRIHLGSADGCSAEELTALCRAHIKAGHRAGLVAAVRDLQRLEPVLALLEADDLDHASAGIVALLDVGPDSSVIERVAARWGPGLAPLLAAAVPHLQRRSLAVQLSRYTRWYPEIDRALTEHMARLPDGRDEPPSSTPL